MARESAIRRPRSSLVRITGVGEEVPLTDGGPSVAGSVLLDGQVHRMAGPWTPAVHELLRHLEGVGFEGAPRPVGFDQIGREVLTWVEGQAPSSPWPCWMQTDRALEDLAVLLRRYHEAVSTFTPREEALWRCWIGSQGGPIIRHGDLWPANVVFRSGRPIALIDWEFAQPGTPVDDLASAAKHWVPLMSDGRGDKEGWRLPLDRPARLRLLCDAYGLDRSDLPELIAQVIRNADWCYMSHKTWGEAGVPGFAEMWQQGSGDVILADQRWLREQQQELLDGV